jgi:hypothetical protein
MGDFELANDSILVGVTANIPRLVNFITIDCENKLHVLSFKNGRSITADTVYFRTLYNEPGRKTVFVKAQLTDNTMIEESFNLAVFAPQDIETTFYKNKFVVDEINWDFRNTPRDFDTSFSLSVDANIRYSGVNLTYQQIDSVKLKRGGLFWHLKYLVNDTLKILGDTNQYRSTVTWSKNCSAFEVDTVIVHTYFKNGEVIKHSVIAPIPGCQNANGYTRVYTEDYTDAVDSMYYYKALARPLGISAIKGVDTMIVSFTINDTSAYNGSVDFFDENNKSVLYSTIFIRDYYSKKITTYINNGNGLYNNGDTNTIKLPISKIDFKTGKSVLNIRYARIIITDGSQFANVPSKMYRESYSYSSMSSKVSVK